MTDWTESMEDAMKTAPISRIHQALAETNRFIAKEWPRSRDLRPADTQALLERYIAHKIKLEAVLNSRA